MAEIHHFTYGSFHPVAAFLIAFLGSFLGLVCTARARETKPGGRRTRWLLIAAVSIGGAGIWLMHFMAILGFEVPNSPIRFDPTLTLVSLALGIVPVGAGLFMVVRGPRSIPRILGGGLFTGIGVLSMHYTGMAAMRIAGTLFFDPGLVGASGVVAVLASTVALWFASAVSGWLRTLAASGVMGLAVCGMHYTGMAALRVRLSPAPMPVDGMSPFLFVVPITLLTALALIAMAIGALQAMTEEEFDGAALGRHRGNPGTAGNSGTDRGNAANTAHGANGANGAGPDRDETGGGFFGPEVPDHGELSAPRAAPQTHPADSPTGSAAPRGSGTAPVSVTPYTPFNAPRPISTNPGGRAAGGASQPPAR